AALKAGAQVAQKHGRLGVTPFYLAARNGHVNVAQLLLDRGADPNDRDPRGNTPLMDVVAHDSKVSNAKFLLDLGAKVDDTNDDGWTALMMACTWDSRWNPLVHFLLERGANVNHI